MQKNASGVSLVIDIIAVDGLSCVDTALWSVVVVVVDFESLSFGSEARRRTRLRLSCTVTFRPERDSLSNQPYYELTATKLTRSANNQRRWMLIPAFPLADDLAFFFGLTDHNDCPKWWH